MRKRSAEKGVLGFSGVRLEPAIIFSGNDLQLFVVLKPNCH